jgi:general secretion pathway protein G
MFINAPILAREAGAHRARETHSQPAARCPHACANGFTMIEILIVLAIVGILARLALGAYDRYYEKTRVSQAVSDIGALAVKIKLYEIEDRALPQSLADVGAGGKLDPWGRPYEYIDLGSMKGNGKARKDKKLAPLNSDFDLYSRGKDGQTKGPLVVPVSRDDVVRARDGAFIGLASDFDP